MKKLLFIIFLFPIISSEAQDLIILNTGDTLKCKIIDYDELNTKIEKRDGGRSVLPNAMIVKTIKDGQFVASNGVGDNLIKASEKGVAGLSIILVTGIISVVGIVALPESVVAFAVVGTVGLIVGEITCISAWKKIRYAGEILKKKNL